jgi:MYXO-CTERM domain-containing protein
MERDSMQPTISRRLISVLALLAGVSLTAHAGGAVLGPSVQVAGTSQAVWGDRWWQWAISYPTAQNPLNDTTGAFSYLGDQGSVFFLAGTVTGPAVRTATVRAGQTVLIPLNTAASPIPLFGADEAAVRADAAATSGPASGLTLTIDGAAATLPAGVTSLTDFHQVTPPGTFPFTIPADNVFGAPSGTYPTVEDGYWVMLDDLSVGTHTVRWTGHFAGTPALQYPPYDVDMRYTLTVTPVPEPGGLVLLALIGLGGFRRRSSTKRP